MVADAKMKQVQGLKWLSAKAAIESEKMQQWQNWNSSSTLSLSIAEKILKDELSNKEAQTKLLRKC
jgi:F-type H+-transporting ATPase subunit b